MKRGETNQGARVIDLDGFRGLVLALHSRGYALFGPRMADNAIVFDEIQSPDDLVVGWTDRQEPGRYRLERGGDGAMFGYVVGPHSWKKYLFPPKERLVQISRNGNLVTASPEALDDAKRALIGVRACDLAAIAVQDKVFTSGAYVDPHYQSRRRSIFIVAVNCGAPASTCFCTSMATGPEARTGFDLALTEVIGEGRHEFVVDIGTELGGLVLSEVSSREASASDLDRKRSIVDQAERRISRRLEIKDIKDLLYRNYESTHWTTVAERCVSCANCTLVCPTCFCSTVEDVTDLSGDHAERWRRWDSCFTLDFSHIVGGSTRASTGGRYRHWMTHKLATWQDQFDTMGCVGCGRCITWCPVGIDITEEIAALRANEQSPGRKDKEKAHDRH